MSDDVPAAEGKVFESSTSAEHISWRPWDREACIELPQEDMLPEDGDAVGLILRSMYWFRTASANWMRDWQVAFEQPGYTVGVANPELFYNAEEGC